MSIAPSTLEMLCASAERRGQSFNVLIVDDERYVREVFRDFCQITKVCSVDIVSSGLEAVEKVKNNIYDLITLDLIMPEISGIDALIKIKDICPQVPVMVVTGNATDKLVDEAGLLGACKVMYKPVSLENFVNGVVETLLEKERREIGKTTRRG
jgi:CheY-like chemotaxis protein